jgi:hypothetical protein
LYPAGHRCPAAEHFCLSWQHVVLSAPSNLSLTSAHVAVAHFLLAMLVWSTNPVGHLLVGHFAWQHVVLSAPSNFSLTSAHVAVAHFLLAMPVWSTNPVGHLFVGQAAGAGVGAIVVGAFVVGAFVVVGADVVLGGAVGREPAVHTVAAVEKVAAIADCENSGAATVHVVASLR